MAVRSAEPARAGGMRPSRTDETLQRALLVVNRQAARAEGALDRVREALVGASIEVDCRVPDDPSTIPEVLRDGAKGADCVILGGGDGTLHHAIEAVRASGLPLGILPLGTANDLARGLGIPPEPEKAVRVIAGGRTRWIDLGRVGGRPFLNVASFGVTGKVTRRLAGAEKRRWGVLSYPIHALAALRESRPFRVELLLPDGRRSLRCIHVAVASGRSYGGGMMIDAESTLDDGLFTVAVIEAGSPWRLVGLLPHLWRGTASRAEAATTFRVPALGVETSRPLDVSADGELVTRTPTRFEVEPRAIRVFVGEEEVR